MELKNKTAIITGAGRGIGEGIALALAREGANVVVNDRNLENANIVVKKIISEGGKAMAFQADVTNKASLDAMVDAAVKKYGSLDIWVNNAGIESQPRLLIDIPEEQWDRTLSVNLKGVYLGMPGSCTANDETEKRTNHQYRVIRRSTNDIFRKC